MFKADWIEKLLKQHPVTFNRVCEVGCGNGEILVQLSKRFQHVSSWMGYDISADAIAIAQMKSSDKLEFALQDVTLAEKSVNFDLMLVIDVIEHLENYFSFLDSISERSSFFYFPYSARYVRVVVTARTDADRIQRKGWAYS